MYYFALDALICPSRHFFVKPQVEIPIRTPTLCPLLLDLVIGINLANIMLQKTGGVGDMPEYLFITGKLAATALSRTLETLRLEGGYAIKVLDGKVAALMNTAYVASFLNAEIDAGKIVIPGLCKGELEVIAKKTGRKVIQGPKDLKDLPAYFGREDLKEVDSIPGMKILAEIVDAPRLSVQQVLERARYYRMNGADYIDIGTHLDGRFPHLGEMVKELKAEGFLVSIDSFSPEDILIAASCGADMVLSVNSANMHVVKDLPCKIVVVPDDEYSLGSLYQNVETVRAMGKEYIIDAILPPLNFGLAEAVSRYLAVRRDFPEAPMLIGIANVTELIDADSTGVNALMTGIAAELRIDYVLTTEYSARTRGSVQEINLARRLMHIARERAVLPKHIDYSLLTIKDPLLNYYSEEELREMQSMISDHSFRIFTDDASIYIFNAHLFLKGKDAQSLFDTLQIRDPGHAFYLGRELHKAQQAIKLGKKYIQDNELDWGYLSGYGQRLKTERMVLL